jgi:hypothetical protein
MLLVPSRRGKNLESDGRKGDRDYFTSAVLCALANPATHLVAFKIIDARTALDANTAAVHDAGSSAPPA